MHGSILRPSSGGERRRLSSRRAFECRRTSFERTRRRQAAEDHQCPRVVEGCVTRQPTVQKFPDGHDGHLSLFRTRAQRRTRKVPRGVALVRAQEGIMAFASPARRLAAICARGVSAQPRVSAVSPVGSVRAPLAVLSSRRRRIFRDVLRLARIPPSITARGATDAVFPSLSRFQTFDGLITRCLSSSAAPGWHCDRRGGGLRGHRARGGRDVPWNAATACDDLASGGGASAAGSRGTFASSRAPRDPRVSHLLTRSRRGLLRDARRGALRQPR